MKIRILKVPKWHSEIGREKADRAREAFESLNDEDKVALMQQVAQEEQMAQQQTMEEQAMAEQQMMNPQVAQEVPQEAMIPQEQVVPQEVPVEAQTMAEGGNLYLDGGILDYVKKNYKGKYANEIANILESVVKQNGKGRIVTKVRGKDGTVREKVTYNRNVLQSYLSDILNGRGNRISPETYRMMHLKQNPVALDDRQSKHYKQLVELGLNPKIAFEMAFPQINVKDYKTSTGTGVFDEAGNYYYDDDLYQKALSLRNKKYADLVGEPIQQEKAVSTTPVISQTVDEPINEETIALSQTVPPSNITSQPAKVNASKSSPQRVASTTNKVQPFNVQNVEGLEFPQTAVSPTVSPDALTMSVAEANGLTTPTIVGGGDTQSSYITTTGNGDNVDSAMREATGVGTNGYVTVNPVTGNVEAVIGNDNTTGKKLAPVLKAEWPRYVGLFGPAVGLGLMAAGVGKPNKKQFDAILDAYDRTGTSLADYKTIGDYLTYRPMDIWAEQNRMNANARATDRAILNNSSPVGTRMAGLLASNYNDQIGSGQLYKNALEYNDSKAAQVAGFNRGTNQYNADAYNRVALANAQMRNQSRHYRAGLAMQAAAQKADMDAGWYNSLYGNIGQLFKGISDLGRENAERNMIARLATAGAFGNLPPENAVNAKLSKWVTAEGGKLKKSKKSKRKGLTF